MEERRGVGSRNRRRGRRAHGATDTGSRQENNGAGP
jgi:hypothetical protein